MGVPKLMVDANAINTSRARWYVVGMLFLVSFLTIVDRVAISAAKNDMARELAVSDMLFGWVFGVFALGYALFQIPSGWLADRYGPRLFLAAIVLLWSLFTGLTGLMYGSIALIMTRFLFGMAEAGAYPGASRAFYAWLPPRERGAAQGILFTGSRLGAAFGLAVISFVIANLGWRASFLLLAAIGTIWAAGWFWWFRDDPAAKKGVSPSELAHIRENEPVGTPQKKASERIPWSTLFLNRSSGLLMLQYFASNFTFFICFSWLLPYLKDHYQLSATQAGVYASIPLYFGAAANWISGITVDWIYRRGRWRFSRLFPAILGFSLSAVSLAVGANMPTVGGAVACFALATFGVDLTLSPSWATCIDVGGKYTGTLSGGMNMIGNLGSFVSSIAFPYLLALSGSASMYFYVAALLNLVAIGCWLGVRPEKQLHTLARAVTGSGVSS
jgi:MFS transporter, ACS family, glucarate transporter